MENYEGGRESLEQVIAEQEGWLGEAVVLLGGGHVEDVFPGPTEVRDDAGPLELTPQQEDKLREIASRFGIGADYDIKSVADYDLLEGGKPWKVLPEIEISDGIKIFAGSAKRVIGDDEKAFLKEKYELEDDKLASMTEHDMVAFLASKQEGFVGEEPVDMGLGYEVAEGNRIIHESTGQLLKIGTVAGKPVYVLRVDRENYIDDEGKSKYRYQPDGTRLLGFVSEWLRFAGDVASSVGLNTSNTYASRALDVIRAGLKDGRDFRVGMYGRATLRAIAEDKVTAQTPINQIPGELHTIATKLEALKAIIDDNTPDEELKPTDLALAEIKENERITSVRSNGGIEVSGQMGTYVIEPDGNRWLRSYDQLSYHGPDDPGYDEE